MRRLFTLVLVVVAGAFPVRASEAQEAPRVFRADFKTSKGEFQVEVHRDWAPLGADRFYNLVNNGFFDDARFFRVIEGFVAQFGLNGDPRVSAAWSEARLEDDPVAESNRRGTITFATAGENSRTTQVFINFKDNSRLDGMGFAPFGEVVSGMEVVDQLYSGYGDGVAQNRIVAEGNEYLKKEFPDLDYVVEATVVPMPE